MVLNNKSIDAVLIKEEVAATGIPEFNVGNLEFLKIFRILRVFRLAKVLRRVKAMRKILLGINKSINNIMFTIILLFLFIIIYVLLGMSIMTMIPDFTGFMNAFFAIFQVLTQENWNDLLYIYIE